VHSLGDRQLLPHSVSRHPRLDESAFGEQTVRQLQLFVGALQMMDLPW
jgi:hypothetical protein